MLALHVSAAGTGEDAGGAYDSRSALEYPPPALLQALTAPGISPEQSVCILAALASWIVPGGISYPRYPVPCV